MVMATLFQNLFSYLLFPLKHKLLIFVTILLAALAALAIGKIYQTWDDDPDRGAISIDGGAFGETYSTPIYLEQGWSESDSLWFYNTTQGSALLPYDFFISLEQQDSTELFRSKLNFDKYRYLPQKETFFNPDGLAVGFAKETYQGKDYVGYTCAACHTSQVNYTGDNGTTTAIRIDGGPAMADMVGFLTALEKSMVATLNNEDKRQRFVEKVLDLNNDYKQEDEAIAGLEQWQRTIGIYNTVNHSHIDYGYARLDAFGRIYNRVLQHAINKPQLADSLRLVVSPMGIRILTDVQIDNVLEGIGENIIIDKQFGIVLERLQSNEAGYPNLNIRDILRIRDQVFNEPDAPVSYPFLWDITHSDYVQWNGVANNSGVGPLGRNAGEVIGVFAILDWTAHKPNGFSLSATLTGQKKKDEIVDFKSSADLVNLQRLEAHLKSLQSPVWPQEILGEIDMGKAQRGQTIYAAYCQSCHQVVDRENWDRLVIAEMTELNFLGTDTAAAINAATYKGKSGNLVHTVQTVDVGDLLLKADAPVVQILTSATKGVIATPDADKMFLRRWLDRIYTHNGSVPTLYHMLVPAERPTVFVKSRLDYDKTNVGFNWEQGSWLDKSEGYLYDTAASPATSNAGHDHDIKQNGKTYKLNWTDDEPGAWALIEYLKTL